MNILKTIIMCSFHRFTNLRENIVGQESGSIRYAREGGTYSEWRIIQVIASEEKTFFCRKVSKPQ